MRPGSRDIPLTEPNAIRLLLVDEHALIRAGVRTILESESDMRVVAEAATLDEALAVGARERPDVVLVDLDSPAALLVDDIHRLRAACAGAAVVMLSHDDSDAELFRAAVAGAAGHVAGVAQPAELLRTIRRAASGQEPISRKIGRRPRVARRVLEAFQQLVARGADGAPQVPLNERELEVLRLAAGGLTNQQIGHQLGISGNTVKSIVTGIMERLGVRYRTQAVVYAVREGWISLPEAEPEAR
ncbi:MAG TPA: response regulator transcription factor [Candidatus Limnocylindrales bacterium]